MQSSYRWWVSFQKIQQSLQYSDLFFTPVLPFCFQMIAFCKNSVLEVGLYRYRGANDNPAGKINTVLLGYSFEIDIISEDGNKESREENFNNPNTNFKIDDGCIRSRGNGWTNFMSPVIWNTWLIKNHIRLFCKIKKHS